MLRAFPVVTCLSMLRKEIGGKRMLTRLLKEKTLNRLLILMFALFWGWFGLQAQSPTLTINPSGNMSVCPGSQVTVNASLTNAFAGTTSYTVGDIPFSPYTLLAGTQLTMPDDTVLGPFPIGFQFCFFGNTYTQFYIGSNGWIGFSPGMTRAFTANSIPSTNMFVPRNCIMGPWMDFNPGIAGGPYIRYQTQGIAPFRRLVVQWTNVPLYQCIALRATFQIVIFESTNIIEHYISNKPTCMAWAGGTATQGLHNLAGSVAVPVPGRNASVWTATNDGKRFTPNGPPSFTINWTANGVPIGTGNSTTTTINGPGNTRIIGRANFQCSNLILYDTLDVALGGAASAAFSVPSPVCAGQAANFTYTGGAAGTGNWTFGSGTPASTTGLGTQSATWATPGTYPVTLTVTPSAAGCSPGTLTQNVVVTAPPTSTFTFPATPCVSTNATISYTGSAPAGATYSWNFGVGATPATASTAGPHTVSWSSAGAKTISLTVTSGTCSSTTTQNITVNAAPVASFSMSPASVCVGANGTITFTGSAAAGSTYTWNFGAGASPLTATGVGPHTVSWATAGAKTISLSVNSGSCSASATQNITVNAAPVASFSLPASICEGSTASISFTGTAAAPPTATYTWNVGGGTPAPGNVQGPFSVSWPTPGSKSVSLTVSQGGCTSAPVTQTIIVNPRPVVSISASAAAICAGQSTTLSVSGTPPATGSTYAWNFGAGATPATSTSAGPVSVSYATAGTFTPSLTVTTAGCTSLPATASVSVQAPPTVSISAPATGCTGAPVTISASGTYALGSTFSWNFAGGTVVSGSGAGPYSVQWATPGVKSISVSVQSGACSVSANASVNITNGPSAAITAPATLCANQNATISFAGSASAGASYSWNFGMNASPATANTVGPHSISYTSPGSKTITLTVTDGSCPAATATHSILVSPGYTATFSVPASVCVNSSGSVSYTGNAPPGSTFNWNFGTGATPATATTVGPHSVSWNTAGTANVSLSVTTAGCTAGPVSQAVSVQALPTSTFNLPATACTGSSVNVAYTGNAGAGASYTWNWGSGATPATSTGQGPHTVSWSTSGVKNVSLSVVQGGCTSVLSTQNITVSAPPTATFSLSASTCVGTAAAAVYTGNAGGGATYAWNFGSGASPATASGVGPHNPDWSTTGSKTVSLVVSQNGCSSAPITQNIMVNAAPTASFTLSNPGCVGEPVTALYTGNAGAGATFSWVYPGASLVSGSGPGPLQLSWPSAGSQTVSLSVSENGCTSLVQTNSTLIEAAPVFSVSAPTYTGLNQSTTISYTGPSLPGATYSWSFDGGTVVSGSGAGPYQVTWNTSGVKNITCSVSYGACLPLTETASTEVISAATASFTTESPICVGASSTITFTGIALSGATFNWNFGGGTVVSGSGSGPYEVSWTSPGAKTVSLEIVQFGISSGTVQQTVQVNAIPTASFSLPAFICEDDAAQINYTGTGSPSANLSWNFGGGLPSGPAGQNNQVTYPSAGNATVTLTVSENGCSSLPVTQTLVVRPRPTAAFTLPSQACVNEPVSAVFTGVAGPSASFNWDFGTGNLLNGSGPGPIDLSWSAAGSETVSLVVTENQCSSTSVSQAITINPIPVASFTVAGNQCAGDTVLVTFTGSAGASAVYTWDFDGATVLSGTQAGPYALAFSQAGNYNIGLSINDQGCVAVASGVSYTADASPVVSFTLADSTFAGLTEAVLFTGQTSDSASFTWTYAGATHQSGAGSGPLNLIWPNAGTYTVSLQVQNGECVVDGMPQTIVVQNLPDVNFSLSTDTACAATAVFVSLNSAPVTGATYTWNFDGALVTSGSGAGPYQVEWTSPGLHTVSVSYSLGGLSSGVAQQNIWVIEIPESSFSMVEEVCAGEETMVFYTANTGMNSQFQWDFENGLVVSGENTGSPTVRWDTAGVYLISLSVADAMCISAPTVQPIIVKVVPTASFEVDSLVCEKSTASIVFNGNAAGNAIYTWNFGSGTLMSGSGAGPLEVQFDEPGLAALSLSVSQSGCSSALFSDTVVIRALPAVDAGAGHLMCSGDSVQLNGLAQAGYTYSWFPESGLSSSSISNPFLSLSSLHDYVETFVYRLTVNDGYCTASDSVEVNLAPRPTAFFNLPPAQCFEGNSFDFTADGSFNPAEASITWNFGPHGFTHNPSDVNQQDITFDIPGRHAVELQISQFGCVSEPFVDSVIVNAHPTARFSGDDVKGCLPLTATLDASESEGQGLSYFWNFGDGQVGTGQMPQHTYTQSGYLAVHLTVVDANGCSAELNRPNFVQVLEQPIAGFRAKPEVVFIGTDFLELTNLSQHAQFSYFVIAGDTIFGSTNSYSFTEPGEYEVTQVVVNAAGCTDQMTVTVRAEFGTEFYIPTAFTPNNDGHNDEFKVVGSDVRDFSLIIFDRWGHEVFSSNDIEKSWDGFTPDRNQPMPEGVYIYRLEMRNKQNRDIIENGSITLIR